MKSFRMFLKESFNKADKEEEILTYIKNNLLSLKLNNGSSAKDTVCWEIKGTNTIKRFKILYNEFDNVKSILRKSGFAFSEGTFFHGRLGFQFEIDNGRKIQFGCSGGKVGSQGNSGHQFEAEFQKDLEEYFKNPLAKLKFPQAIHKLLTMVKSQFGADVISSSHDGGENKKRKVSISTGKIDIDGDNEENKDNANVGSTVTDITLNLSNGKQVFLSLKVGDAKFLNKGVGSALPQSEIKNGKITNEAGVKLLKMLGIDNYYFCEVYKALDEKRKKDSTIPREVKISSPSKELKKFIEEAIGYGYIMVKREKRGSNNVLIQNFTKPEFAQNEANSIEDVRVIYPSQNKDSKTISVSMKTKHYIITIVIRNRSGIGKVFPNSMDVNYRTRT